MSVLFLDIDGVLRRRGAPLYRLEAPLRDAFEALVRDLPEVQIVISSTWREGFSLAEIREHFSPDVGFDAGTAAATLRLLRGRT